VTTQQSRDRRLALARKHIAAEFDTFEQAGACFVATPFLRRDNDPVVLRIEELPDGRLVITDDGETVDYLRLSGHSVRRNSAFQKQLQAVVESLGVRAEDDEILVETDEGGFAEALTAVARAAQHTSYLAYRGRARGTGRFEEQVQTALLRVGARFERGPLVPGRTGLRQFAFHVNGKSNALLQPISGSSREAVRNKAERFVFRVVDVRAGGGDDIALAAPYRFFPILDDAGRAAEVWDAATIEMLHAYSDGVIRWSLPRVLDELGAAVGTKT
jgi:hypothetical protein